MAAVDETGEEVQRRFVDFLENYEKADAEPSLYETRIEQMLDNEHSTLYVDFAQIITHDSELADAVVYVALYPSSSSLTLRERLPLWRVAAA